MGELSKVLYGRDLDGMGGVVICGGGDKICQSVHLRA